MPNLTTPFPDLKGEDISEDMQKVKEWSISLIDELKYIFCNLDAGNVTEAGSVKAQNIDCTKARIRGAQIQSLTADKISAGTIDAELIGIKDTSGNGAMEIAKQAMQFFEGNQLRIYIGRDNNGNYIFLVQNADASQGIYMNESGNIVVTGVFSTGTEGQARTIIDKNGIQSYNALGQKDGLWCNDANDNGQRFSDLTLYDKGHEIFRVYNDIAGSIGMKSYGMRFLTSRGIDTVANGNWSFSKGSSGSFQTADGKTVTVSGGLITDIS